MNAPISHPLPLALLDRYQRHFPLCPRPYAEVAGHDGWDEGELLAALRAAAEAGVLSRIGAVFAPNTVAASTLAALAVPPDQLAAVAAQVSARREVSHNYQRSHAYNLWFVATAADRAALDALLAGIAADSGLPVLDVPLEREYHIDLGFALHGEAAARTPLPPSPGLLTLSPAQRRLLAALGPGLALTPRPYLALAQACELSEAEVLATLAHWQAIGALRRFGLVLRHHELGYRANVMCVWQIPPAARDAIGTQLAQDPAVTLCYARPARPPHWPYTLFAMVHGKSRAEVDAAIDRLIAQHALAAWPHARLYTLHRYAQRGPHYA